MKKFYVLLSTALLASKISYAELDLSRESIEKATGISEAYNTR